jgi:anti-anti-sigma factor
MNEKQMLLTVESVDNAPLTRILRFTGDLDSTNAETVSEEVQNLLSNGVLHIVADFTKLRYVNSTGLGALLFVNKKMKEAGGSMKIACVNENVYEIIEIIGANTLLEIHRTMDEALATLK